MPIDIKSLTGGEVEGNGVFDELMRTVNSHIEKQFSEGRIVGGDFANVYLGSVQSALAQASQFTLQAPIQTQQELLVQQQVENAKKQEELLTAQIAGQLLQNEINQYQLDNMLPAQLAQLQAQTRLVEKQILQADSQITLTASQNSKVIAETSLVGKQEDLIDEQILGAKDAHTDPTGGTNKAQFDKINSEKDLIEQRIVTEVGQTNDKADGVNDTGGLLGAEIALKTEQKDSFDRDAEQKLSKIYSDIFSIIFSTNPSSAYANPGDWGLGQSDSDDVLEKARQGIGLP